MYLNSQTAVLFPGQPGAVADSDGRMAAVPLLAADGHRADAG